MPSRTKPLVLFCTDLRGAAERFFLRRWRAVRRMIRVSEKRLAARYSRRIFLASIPALTVLISLLAVVVVFVIYLDADVPQEVYLTIFYAAYASTAYGAVVCLIGSIMEDILIKAHRENTYIQISGSVMVVSQHSRSAYIDGKWVHYKKMWVIDLADVENVECIRNHLTIKTKARYFHEDASWISYHKTDDGISFDRWWYNENGGKNVDSVDITDFYTFGDRIADHIDHCAGKSRQRELRRQAFRNEMLEIAKNVKRPQRLPDRYKEPERNPYRSKL